MREGFCGFGPIVDFLADLWPKIPVRIAHINPRLPHVRGAAGIPFSELTAVVEQEQPLLQMADAGTDPTSEAIARNVARWIGDGATVQAGLGKIPTAALRALCGRRGLRIHSGLVSEAVVDLEEAGALASGVAVTGGVAIGTQRLYDAVGGSAYRFEPVAYTHSPRVLSEIANFVSINSALEVDLFGQAYAEMGPGGLMSGPGGASDFARGAYAARGPQDRRPARIGRQGRASAASSDPTQGPDLFRSAGWTPTSSSPSSAPPISAASATTVARRR